MADCWVGLDLGKHVDYAAASVLGRSLAVNRATGLPFRNSRGGAIYRWDVIGLKRFPLRTPYTEVIAEVDKIVRRPELRPQPRLIVDATGVGIACLEMVRSAIGGIDTWGVVITGGESWRMAGRGLLHAAKIQVTGAVREVLESERLKIAKDAKGRPIPGSDWLKRELTEFKATIRKSGSETFGAESGAHDDMVLSIALPIWAGSLPIGPMRMRELEFGGDDPQFRAREAAAMAKERKAVEVAEIEALALERGGDGAVEAARRELEELKPWRNQVNLEDERWWR